MKATYEELEKQVKALKQQISNLGEEIRSEDGADRFSGLLKNTPDAVYILDFSGKFIDANRSALRMLGYGMEELRTLNFFDLIPEDQRRFATDILSDRSKMTGYARSIEFRIRRKDGKALWIETKAVAIFDNDTPVEIHGIAVDITERKVREAALKKREEDLLLALNGADLGIWYWDIETGTVKVEREWGDRLRLSDTATLNYQNWTEWVHPEDREKTRSYLREYLAGITDSFQVEHRLKAEDESWIWVISRGKIVEYDGSGNPKRIAGTYHDISYRIQMEQDLLRRQAELREKSLHLEETNTALKVLLKQREKDRDELSEDILSNIRELVLPYLEKVEAMPLNEKQTVFIRTAKSNLDEIVSPFARKLSSKYLNLTPTEMRVADLVKMGKTTKEIADIMNLSKGTIDFHRDNIRSKTGIKNKNVNLRTHLLSYAR